MTVFLTVLSTRVIMMPLERSPIVNNSIWIVLNSRVSFINTFTNVGFQIDPHLSFLQQIENIILSLSLSKLEQNSFVFFPNYSGLLSKYCSQLHLSCKSEIIDHFNLWWNKLLHLLTFFNQSLLISIMNCCMCWYVKYTTP